MHRTLLVVPSLLFEIAVIISRQGMLMCIGQLRNVPDGETQRMSTLLF